MAQPFDETFDEASEYLTNYLLPTSTAKTVTAARATAETLAMDLNYEPHIEDGEGNEEDDMDAYDERSANPEANFNSIDGGNDAYRDAHPTTATTTTTAGERSVVSTYGGDTMVVEEPNAEEETFNEEQEEYEYEAEGETMHQIVYAEDHPANVTATGEDELVEEQEGENGEVDDEELMAAAELLLAEDMENGEDESDEDAMDGDEENDVVVVEERAPNNNKSSAAAPPPFAISRLKNLFKFAESAAMEGFEDPSVTFSLSSDAALLLSEAVQLLVEDFAGAALAEAGRHNRKTVSYDDVALQAYQLDRFHFASDVLPLSAAPPSVSAGGTAKVAGTNVAKQKQPQQQLGKQQQQAGSKRTGAEAKPQASTSAPIGGGKRQQTLFAK